MTEIHRTEDRDAYLFHAPQDKRPQDAVKPADKLSIDARLALHHAGQGVAKPALKLCMAGEDMGHEKMHEAPELHEVVLEGGSSN